MEIQLGNEALFQYNSSVISYTQEEFDTLFDLLGKKERKCVKMFGKTYMRPRKEAVWGKDIKYSGVTITKEVNNNCLVDKVMDHANKERESKFTWCLVNLYESGDDYVDWHRDNEKDVKGNEVHTYSFGSSRVFEIRPYDKNERKKRKVEKIELEPGSCGIMKGQRMQIDFQHRVPKKKNVGPRISITPRM